MNIDWAALGAVFGVSLVATVALVGLFALGVVSLARQESAGARSAGGAARTGQVLAYACFALCAAAVAYGIYLIVA
ncbi:hypothetical protein GCM10009654_68280 [Streptomyces hebeiensis]|uniref:Secreted protein n=1 Tax=Streptomyces hebeiensis TaxID=229486 RepID=A0ABP4FVC9_9ACTN